MDDAIQGEVRAYIVEAFLFGQAGDSLGFEDLLLEQRILDSTGILELVAFLNERYGIRVADEELLPENFGTIARVAAFVRRKQT